MDVGLRLPACRLAAIAGSARLERSPAPLAGIQRAGTAGRPTSASACHARQRRGASNSQRTCSASRRDVAAAAAADVVISADFEIPGQQAKPRTHLWRSPHDGALLGLVIPSLAAVLMDSAMSLADVGASHRTHTHQFELRDSFLVYEYDVVRSPVMGPMSIGHDDITPCCTQQ